MKHIDEQIEKIYNLRMNRGISRSDLAKKAGVSQQQIAKILDTLKIKQILQLLTQIDQNLEERFLYLWLAIKLSTILLPFTMIALFLMELLFDQLN